MIDQVTSVEQSKRLLELGVPTEKASMWWCDYRNHGDEKNRYKLVLADQIVEADFAEYIPAFTVADLLELLPYEIDADCGLCFLQIKKLYACRDYIEWGLYYKNDDGDIPFESITSYGIIEALFDMVEKLYATADAVN